MITSFDKIPHAQLLKSVARRIVDRHVLRLIKLWLKTPVEERDGEGRRRLTGGKQSTCGTPQGGVVSPLLANLYMNRFLKHWRKTGRSEAFRGHVVSYADDFVILCRGHAVEALAWTKAVMTKLGLTLNETKTQLRDARMEHFDFLGYTFGPYHSSKNGRRYLGAGPSKKSVGRLKTRVREILIPSNLKPWPEVCKQLNALLRGWAAYFSHGTRMKAYRVADNHVEQSVRHFLRRRHKIQTQGFRRFSGVELRRTYGVLCLRQMHLEPLPLKTPAWTELPNDLR